jgi:Domain of unknown function (DUF4135)
MNVEQVVLDGLTPSEYCSLTVSTRNSRRIRQIAPDFKETSELLSLIRSKSTLPTWVSVFQSLVESLQRSRTRYRPRLGITNNLAYAVMHHGWREIGKILAERGGIMLSRGARHSLRESFLSRLSFTGGNAAAWMWNVLRGSSKILIDSREENWEQQLCEIVFANGVEPLTLGLLEHHPALARLWSIQIANWTSYMSEFLGHAKAFAREHLGSVAEPQISKIEPNLSDPHSGNRSVMAVFFARGGQWYYKPRSGQCEEAWFALLQWLNEQNFPVRFALVKIVSGDDHCWMQAVQHRPCRNKKEAAHYYFRAGALLFIIHWLRGVDFHAGNLVAHGPQPVVVDCETLLHPTITVPRNAKRGARSILRTGMLPVWNRNTKLSDSVSALGRMTFGPHSVWIKGKTVLAIEFIDSITDGFRTMHKFLSGPPRRCSDVAKLLTQLQQVQCRRLYEPTGSYYRRLEQSLRVSCLVSGRARHQALRRLCRIRRQAFPGYVWHEVQSLENADIPIFRGKPLHARRYSVLEMNRDIEIIRRALGSNSKHVERVVRSVAG